MLLPDLLQMLRYLGVESCDQVTALRYKQTVFVVDVVGLQVIEVSEE